MNLYRDYILNEMLLLIIVLSSSKQKFRSERLIIYLSRKYCCREDHWREEEILFDGECLRELNRPRA